MALLKRAAKENCIPVFFSHWLDNESEVNFRAPTFTVHGFLKSLFTETYHKAIDKID
jgi:hypothetical protein